MWKIPSFVFLEKCLFLLSLSNASYKQVMRAAQVTFGEQPLMKFKQFNETNRCKYEIAIFAWKAS